MAEVAPDLPPGRTFVDDDLEERFSRDGFVVVPFLSSAEVAALHVLYADTHAAPASGFSTDLEHADEVTRSTVTDRTDALWERHLPSLLVDHRPFMTGFLMKAPGAHSELGVHQDWTYVDEQAHPSVAVWVALDAADDDLDNGPLRAIPGSHRFAVEYRGTATRPWYAPYADEFFEAMVTVPARAGDAVIMDNRLVHASPPNRSRLPRLALAAAVAPRSAQLIHAVALDEHLVRVVAVDDTFFRRNTPQGLRDRPPRDLPELAVVPRVIAAPDRVAIQDACGIQVDDSSPALGPDAPPSGHGAGRILTQVLRANHASVRRATRQAPGPFYDATAIPWLSRLESMWTDVRDEYLQVTRAGVRPASMGALAGADLGNRGAWEGIVLLQNGGWIEANVNRFPKTVFALREIPHLRAAFFSVLAPGAEIVPHRGPNNGVLRAHVCLLTGRGGSCTLHAGHDRRSYEEGRAFAFDDTFEHCVTNHSWDSRVTLMLEVDRPLPPLRSACNRAVQWLFRFHPQVRGANRRIVEIDDALNG